MLCSSLCDLRVLYDSVVRRDDQRLRHRVVENAEMARRKSLTKTPPFSLS